jgi:hypothetical protein
LRKKGNFSTSYLFTKSTDPCQITYKRIRKASTLISSFHLAPKHQSQRILFNPFAFSDNARDKFRQIHSEWSKRSEEIKKKYDTAIKKSRPYYEAGKQHFISTKSILFSVAEERKLREQAQTAAIRFERANTMLQVAKQQVKLTQDSLSRQKVFEPECLEVLNHHVQRVNEAEQERVEAEEAHKQISQQMIQCTLHVRQVAKDNSRSIKKTRHYFDMHLDYKRRLEQQKQLISKLEVEVKQKKRDYTSSLRNLEQISDSIHEERSVSSRV